MKGIALVLVVIALGAVGCGGDGGDTVSSAGQVPFDQAFIDAMVPHHREAIRMAKAAQARGLSQPELQAIAKDIVRSQQVEIDRMLHWRERWFGSRTLGPVIPDVLGVPEAELGMEHGSADEIAGAIDVDATFAELMIPHHDGAIAMAQVAKELAEHDEISGLAELIIDAQKREIGILEDHASAEHHG